MTTKRKTNKNIRQGVIDKWLEQKEDGDISRISEQSNISRSTLHEAFNGTASSKTIIAINKYFRKKRKAIKKSEL